MEAAETAFGQATHIYRSQSANRGGARDRLLRKPLPENVTAGPRASGRSPRHRGPRRLPFGSAAGPVCLAERFQQPLQAERSFVAKECRVDDLGQIDRAVARVHAALHAAIEPGQRVAKDGASRRGRLGLQVGELVGFAGRLQAKPPDQFELRLVHEVDGKRPGAFDQLPGLVRLGDAGHDAGHLGSDRRRIHERGNQTAAAISVRGGDDPDLAFDPLKDGGGGRRVQGSLSGKCGGEMADRRIKVLDELPLVSSHGESPRLLEQLLGLLKLRVGRALILVCLSLLLADSRGTVAQPYGSTASP